MTSSRHSETASAVAASKTFKSVASPVFAKRAAADSCTLATRAAASSVLCASSAVRRPCSIAAVKSSDAQRVHQAVHLRRHRGARVGEVVRLARRRREGFRVQARLDRVRVHAHAQGVEGAPRTCLDGGGLASPLKSYFAYSGRSFTEKRGSVRTVAVGTPLLDPPCTALTSAPSFLSWSFLSERDPRVLAP